MIITLTGSNNYLLRTTLKQLVADFVVTHGDLALEKLDGEEVTFERITESIQSLPFLASKKLVVLTSPGAVKKFAEDIAKVLETVTDSTDLIIVEPKLDKRSSYYKQLKKLTTYKEFNEMDGPALARWLVEAAKSQGGTLESRTAMYLVDRVGVNQQVLHSELGKLLSYDKNVTRESIDLLTEPAPQSTVFELLDAAFAGDIKKTFRLYGEQRQLKVEPQAILGMIAWQLHALALTKAGGTRTADEIAREAKMSPYVIKKSQALARRLTGQQVKNLVHDALTLDIRLKSESIDADEALQNLLLRIARPQV